MKCRGASSRLRRRNARPAHHRDDRAYRDALVGTLGFLSPEQARGELVDARADVWALGATLYRLLVGRGHATGTAAEILALTMRSPIPDPRLAIDGVPDPLAELVGRMGALEPADRPADGSAVASALAEILG